MSDLVERLRYVARDYADGIAGMDPSEHFCWEAADEIERLQAENERLREALEDIERWSQAYPLTVFPEPDFARARELLKAGGMTLDAISASAMRHVVEGVGKIARTALGEKK